MTYFSDIQLNGTQLRREAIEESHAAGLVGATRLPHSVHTANPSDSMLLQCLDALAEGQEQRAKQKATTDYMRWLARNREHLGDAIDTAVAQGCTDISAWLRARFEAETGLTV